MDQSLKKIVIPLIVAIVVAPAYFIILLLIQHFFNGRSYEVHEITAWIIVGQTIGWFSIQLDRAIGREE